MMIRVRTGRFSAAAILSAAMALSSGGCVFGHRHRPPPLSAPAPVVSHIPTVVRPAPDFVWVGAGNKGMTLKSLQGQPVVLVIGPSPDDRNVRKQAELIGKAYLDLSARKVVCVAAFSVQTGRVASNVPYAIAANGAAVAKAYGVPDGGFAVVVIGPKGNMDLISNDPKAGARLLDMINNAYDAQAATRTGLGS